ncbi:MAG: hypothetical protein PHS14_00950 [Elusimicrobia bacterium]|nr:hypothetical protein [Elusimicrobiota bacterium]
MRALSFALLLACSAAAPASAQEAETGLRAQKARELVDALPAEARVELKKMYRRYKEVVARKLESGWRTGVLSEAVIEDVDEPFQPARLVSGMIELRKKEIAKLQEALKALASDDPYNDKRLRAALEAKREELNALVAQNKREKGLCRDWSDLIWSEFMSMDLEYWGARDERRATRPYHTAAVACSPADSPEVCLAFDPWEDGRPSVFAYGAWDESAPGGRFPAEYFLHGLPDKVEKAEKKP